MFLFVKLQGSAGEPGPTGPEGPPGAKVSSLFDEPCRQEAFDIATSVPRSMYVAHCLCCTKFLPQCRTIAESGFRLFKINATYSFVVRLNSILPCCRVMLAVL